LQVRFLPGVFPTTPRAVERESFMPSVKDKEKPMGTINATGGADELRPRPSATGRYGFFSVYKPGQGYWTRLGTAFGAALVLALLLHFMWTQLPPWFIYAMTPQNPTTEQATAVQRQARNVTIIVCAVTSVGLALLAWWIMNKPTHADFLIATDGEMKKVNWTKPKDLIGSTKVVILFMFMIAAFLFVVDILFGYIFYFIDVLKTTPL
jgi:preprotein translocase subunit SecE